MSLREKLGLTKDFLQIILLMVLIVVGTFSALWIGASVWAHVAERNVDISGLPKMPPESKAKYIVQIETTGETLLVNEWEAEKSPEDSARQVYIFHGFYRVVNGKWVWNKDTFSMDEFYWGEIKVRERR